jgi:hypothetical protein
MGNNITVGLFGTCDNIRWRDKFMMVFDRINLNYFNPMVDDWHPGLVDDENRHLKEDEIILFPVLAESLGTGSLGEIGFSVLNAVRNIQNDRVLIVLIDQECNPIKEHDEAAIKQSCNARKLVRSKLIPFQSDNVILVDTMEEMLECCLDAVHVMTSNQRLSKYRKTA